MKESNSNSKVCSDDGIYCFIISLKRSTQRRAFLEKHTVPVLEELGIQWQYFDAIDGAELTNISHEVGRLGCLNSHLKIIQKAFENPTINRVMILEDDAGSVQPASQWKQFLEETKDQPVAYLGGNTKNFLQAHGIVYHRDCLHDLLQFFSKWYRDGFWYHQKHYDWALLDFYKKYQIKPVMAEERLLIQNNALGSDNCWHTPDRASIDHAKLKDVLNQHSNWEYLPNNGNLGNAVVGMASFHMFKELNLNVSPFNPQSSVPLIVAGGSGLIQRYGRLRKSLRSIKDRKRRVIVLPHTVKGPNSINLLQDFSNLLVFGREWMTINRLKRNGIPCTAEHDMSFSLQLNAKKNKDTRSLMAMRTDSEVNHRLKRTIPLLSMSHWFDASFDVSATDFQGEYDESNSNKFANEFLCRLSPYDHIVTDRIQVAIACCLLKKHVFVLDNDYHKNHKIFKHSLIFRYPNVKLLEV